MTPTNTDLAAALREIADTLPLGSALIVRLAADRLGEPAPVGDGWIEWDATAPDSRKGPFIPNESIFEVRFRDGDTWRGEKQNAIWGEIGSGTIVAYRIVPA